MFDIFRKKSIDKILQDTDHSEGPVLKRVLSAVDLTAIGIGCIIGTGIFVLTGVAAIKYAGPGIMISFIISGLACAFAALCYAEFASLVPIAGSAYTYGYATLGEVFAWIIGWDLILEYAVSSGAVAIGWSGYFVNLMKSWFGIDIPPWLCSIQSHSNPHGYINLFAALIVLAITVLLVVGIKESAKVNSFIVVVKVVIAILFIAIGAFFVKPANWTPLVPRFVEGSDAITNLPAWISGLVPHVSAMKDPLETPLIQLFFHSAGWVYPEGFGGWPGIFTAAAIVFFAYIGFDAVSTAAEEAKKPQRDLPIGILASLVICTVLYIAMSAVFTGIVRCDGTLKVADMGTAEGAPMAYAFQQTGVHWVQTFASGAISVGAICGITSVLLVTLLGQSRVFFSMSRDKLLPPFVGKIHPKFQTPYITTIVTGVLVAFAAAVTPIEIIAELANIGTLFAFVIVCAGILFLRKMDVKTAKPTFRTPWSPYVPILGILFSMFLMLSLPIRTWYRFGAWLIIGLTIYACYSYFNSPLREKVYKANQALALSIIGIIYVGAGPWFIKLFEPLLVGETTSTIFVILVSMALLIFGVIDGFKEMKIQEGREKQHAQIAAYLGIAGILLMWILHFTVPVYKFF
jgi:APA family basic amino acid/polyamine antiporter